MVVGDKDANGRWGVHGRGDYADCRRHNTTGYLECEAGRSQPAGPMSHVPCAISLMP
jgi:hypothetical protein